MNEEDYFFGILGVLVLTFLLCLLGAYHDDQITTREAIKAGLTQESVAGTSTLAWVRRNP